MTKVICVNRRLFNKSLGYGSWGIITTLLIVFTPISMIETSTLYTDYGDTDMLSDNKYCYSSITYQKEICYGWLEAGTDDRTIILQTLLTINLIAISIYAYNKQQKFKLSWCEKK